MKQTYKQTISAYRLNLKNGGSFVSWSPAELKLIAAYRSLSFAQESMDLTAANNSPKIFDLTILKLITRICNK